MIFIKIGIIDSGIGGLSIYDKLKDNHEVEYLMDVVNYPYGNKPKDFIIKQVRKLINELIFRDCELVIIACFTASILTKDEEYVIDVIKVTDVLEETIDSSIQYNFLCTTNTYKSEYLSEYENIKKLDCQKEINYIEDNIENSSFFENVTNLENVIFGCTHFSKIKHLFKGNALDISEHMSSYIGTKKP